VLTFDIYQSFVAQLSLVLGTVLCRCSKPVAVVLFRGVTGAFEGEGVYCWAKMGCGYIRFLTFNIATINL